MTQSITINSINYDGELANVIFTPANSTSPINLGDITLPFVFEPSLISPSLSVYGVYTILVLGSDCPNILNVPLPTPSTTPTKTPTRTPTPTPTPTVTPTPSYDPCKVSPTPSITPSKTLSATPTRTPTQTPTLSCHP